MPKNKIFAVGDLQGCLQPLQRLIEKSKINLDKDQLWFVGDLLNRGPQSLETLRFVKSLQQQSAGRVKVVLGNHDLHLLALSVGVKKPSMTPGMKEVLDAKDSTELTEWLRHQPLLYRDKGEKLVLVHAGIYPNWSIKKAAAHASEVEQVLQSDKYPKLLKKMYGKRPAKWSNDLADWARYRFIINTLTRMRFCTRKGALNFSCAGKPGTQSRVQYPWYQLHLKQRKNWRIVFGHWASAGAWFDGNHIALDSGCVWGEKMTMARIDDRFVRFKQVRCRRER
jgi:bis(5'-nucleosyl)-tetraphosphatase (symmetrical)